MQNCSSIFLITVFEKCDKDEYGFPDLGSCRTVGFKHEFSNAERIVNDNICDIYETCYTYACIEELSTDLYPMANLRKFYKYNKRFKGYEEIEEPDNLKNVYNICNIC